MKNLKINMLSSSEKVAGQGVSGAYRELMRLLKRDAPNLEIVENQLSGNFDITHYHTIDPIFYATTFSKKFGRKIGYVHFLPETLKGSLKIPKIFMPLAAKYVTSFYNRMDKLVVVNPIFIEDLVEFGIPREKIAYIPNFVNKEKWSEADKNERAEFRRLQNWSDEDLVVFGAGQIQKRKGIDDFVRLAEENPDVKFVWAGGFSFGKMTDGYEKYKKIVENPPKNLTFTDIIPQEEIRRFYAGVDLFLLPSFNELFPMTILEAASCGVPIMLRDLDLYRVILKGKYIAAADFEQMNKKIREIRQDREILAEFKEKAVAISKQYSEESLLKIWQEFYAEQSEK